MQQIAEKLNVFDGVCLGHEALNQVYEVYENVKRKSSILTLKQAQG